jgi:hypothetical protein
MSMTKDQIERCDALWRELLAAERVRWIDGMLARADGWEPLRLVAELVPSGWSGVAVWTDPATIGCLVSLAREATGDATAYGCVVPGALLDGEDRWCVGLPGTRRFIRAETEPEALLLAIQAATA